MQCVTTSTIRPPEKANQRVSAFLIYSDTFQVIRGGKFSLEHPVLSDFQHGFRENFSTKTALMDYIVNALNNKNEVVALFYDLSRAFDTISHTLLLNKLERLGIMGVANEWLKSYLAERKFRVVIGEHISEEKIMISRVPQGSLLGPILFILFINDIGSNETVNCKVVAYVDDTNFLVKGETLEDLINTCNLASNKFVNYCSGNGLKVNIGKTFHMRFIPKAVSLDRSILLKLGSTRAGQCLVL